jgi:acyl carrier protein
MANTIGDLRQTIVDTINKVRTDSGRESLSANDSDALTGELGLDSLDLAVLVVSLEKSLGVDPFRDGSTTARTLGELVTVYQRVQK